MSYFPKFFGDGKKSYCFLWKVNEHNEIVIEALDDPADKVVSSSRKMCVLHEYNLLNELNDMLQRARPNYCVVRRLCLGDFGCFGSKNEAAQKLCDRLNAKKSNFAKRLIEVLSYNILPIDIWWNRETNKWEVVPEK